MGYIEMLVKPIAEIFYAENTFGIYRVEVLDIYDSQVEFGDVVAGEEVSIKGYVPKLKVESSYIVKVAPKNDARYGLGYEVGWIHEKAMSTRDEVESFLKTILTLKQATSIIDAYPEQDVLEKIKDGSFDYSKVKGVGKKTFDTIREKVIENEKYQKAIIELTVKFGIPYNAIKRLSDKYGSPEMLVEKLGSNPYILMEVDGYGFKRADEIALSMGVEETSSYRVKAGIAFILNTQANRGHSWVKKNRMINDVVQLLKIKIQNVRDVLSDVDESDDFEVKDDKAYVKKYKKAEQEVERHLFRILEEDSISKTSASSVGEKIKEIELSQGFEYTDEQKKAINLAVNQNVIVINGKAGTGKTSVIKGIVEVLQMTEGLGYATCALSGKASQRIQESTGLDSYTIHRLLKYKRGEGFLYNEQNPLSEDVVILDEASMVNSELFRSLLQSIKSGAKLIITGDVSQLEPIGVGNVLLDVLKSDKIPMVELTIVHRQAQKSGILSSANMVREGKGFVSNDSFKKGFVRVGELGDLYMYRHNKKENIKKRVLSIAKKYNGDILDFQVITPMRKRGELSADSLNKSLQLIFNGNPNGVSDDRKIKRGAYDIIEGDKIITNGNNNEKMVYNGTLGIVTHIDTKAKDKKGNTVGEVVINFESIGNMSLTMEEVRNIDLAYAITCHKSQGSQWKYVVFAMDYSSYIMLNRQLVYTAMTRASEALFMVVEMEALERSIKTDNSSKRKTFLLDLLLKTKSEKSFNLRVDEC